MFYCVLRQREEIVRFGDGMNCLVSLCFAFGRLVSSPVSPLQFQVFFLFIIIFLFFYFFSSFIYLFNNF